MNTCGKCSGAIQQESAIYGAHRLWHVGHFRCHACERSINEDDQYALVPNAAAEQGKGGAGARENELSGSGATVLCKHCFEEQSAVRCTGCNRGVVSTRYLVADGRPWHEGCLRCAYCQEMSGSFVRDEEGRPLHEACYIDVSLRVIFVEEATAINI